MRPTRLWAGQGDQVIPRPSVGFGDHDIGGGEVPDDARLSWRGAAVALMDDPTLDLGPFIGSGVTIKEASTRRR